MKKIKKKKRRNRKHSLKTYKIARSTFVLNIEEKNKQKYAGNIKYDS